MVWNLWHFSMSISCNSQHGWENLYRLMTTTVEAIALYLWNTSEILNWAITTDFFFIWSDTQTNYTEFWSRRKTCSTSFIILLLSQISESGSSSMILPPFNVLRIYEVHEKHTRQETQANLIYFKKDGNNMTMTFVEFCNIYLWKSGL